MKLPDLDIQCAVLRINNDQVKVGFPEILYDIIWIDLKIDFYPLLHSDN